MFPPNNFGCFQWLPTVAYESAGFCLVLSCLLHSSMPAFLWSLCSALDTDEALNPPLSLIQVRPEKQWGEHCTVSFGVFFVELAMRQCYYCRHSHFMSIALKLCFFFFYTEGSDVQFWDVFSERLLICDEWLCSLCHQPANWSLGLPSFLYIFICLVKLIQHPGFKYHPYTKNSEVDISNQHFDIANSLRHTSMFNWSGASEQDPVMFLSFCLYTGPAHFRKNSSASHYLTATILVQVAIIFDLDLRCGLLAGFIVSFLASV